MRDFQPITLSGWRHELQVYPRKHSSWWIFGGCLVLLALAKMAGMV